MKPNTKEFYDCLFDPEDRTCFGRMTEPEGKLPGIYNTDILPCSAPAGQKQNYVVINPMHTSRKLSNVTKFRNFMVEMDYTDLSEQKRLIKQMGLPWSTATFSGGKSIHFIVSLQEPLQDAATYKKVALKLYAALEIKKRGEDQGNKNATRFSRTPNVYRPDKGTFQHLLKVNGRVDNATFFKWLDCRFNLLGISHEDFEPKVYKPTPKPVGAVEMSDPDKYDWVKTYIMKGDVMERNRHLYIFKVASGCNRVGLSPHNARYYMGELTGWCGDRCIQQDEIDKQVACAYENTSDHGSIFLEARISKEEYKKRKALEKLNKI